MLSSSYRNQDFVKCRSVSLPPFLLSFLPSHIFSCKEKNSTIKGGQFAGMSVNIFSTGGSICRNVRQKRLIQRGQLSGMGGQLNRNRGSINFGIYRYLAGTHKIIAIIPPKVSIAARKKVDGNALIEQQKTESINFQREMYSWMLKRKMQGTIFVDIQDVETTNAKLSNAGFYNGNNSDTS